MAKFNYNKMRDTAARLLDRFAQGDMASEVTVYVQPPEPWEPPTATTVTEPFLGVLRGVAADFVDGVAILSSDLQLTSITRIDIGSNVMIDGTRYKILRHDPIPAAGVAVVHRYFLR